MCARHELLDGGAQRTRLVVVHANLLPGDRVALFLTATLLFHSEVRIRHHRRAASLLGAILRLVGEPLLRIK